MALIYLIDDNEGFNVLTQKVIERLDEGFQIEKFSNPDEALDKMLELDKFPDYIFLDINMPRLDGWELLSILEDEKPEELKNSSLVMLTTSILPADMQKAEENEHVKYYINKPLSEYYAKKILVDDRA